MVTFGDMMALLLTFFILLFSFSEMDATRYKAVSDALEESFGPGITKDLQGLVTKDGLPDAVNKLKGHLERPETLQQQLENALTEEIKQGSLEIEKQGIQTIVRFPERVAFPTASESLRPQFDPVLDKVVQIIEKSEGTIIITGHTDNVPIYNDRFRSNWDLSAARAVSVVHAILERSNIDPTRLVAQGVADTQPLKENSNKEFRAMNRRVEISIIEAK
jgi:chemotaxis protein MotB